MKSSKEIRASDSSTKAMMLANTIKSAATSAVCANCFLFITFLIFSGIESVAQVELIDVSQLKRKERVIAQAENAKRIAIVLEKAAINYLNHGSEENLERLILVENQVEPLYEQRPFLAIRVLAEVDLVTMQDAWTSAVVNLQFENADYELIRGAKRMRDIYYSPFN